MSGGGGGSDKVFDIGATSLLKDTRLAAFINDQLTENLSDVPGIGPANAKLLEAAGIATPYQLLGQFLLLKARGANSQVHLNAVVTWLAEAGVVSSRAVIAYAIAEKARVMMPGVFNPDELNK